MSWWCGQRCLSCGQFIFSYSLSCFWLSSCLVAVEDFEVVETTLGADDSVDGRAVVLPSSTMRVVDGMAGVVVESSFSFERFCC